MPFDHREDARFRAMLGEDELVTLPSTPRATNRFAMRLPPLYRQFLDYEATRRGVTASEIIRQALFQTKEWAAWDKARRDAQQNGRDARLSHGHDARYAPDGVETVRAKAERLKAEREAKEAEIEAWRQKYISIGRPVPGEG